jgi:serine/threonine protein kinase, bacterial
MTALLKNRYRILRSLNSGGFGETFLAEDTDLPSARRCVIKKLMPIANDPQIYQLVKERFQREAIILERLGEGNLQIPSLYAYFEESGEFYLVQEWIEGTTLSEKVRQDGILNEASVREILVSILSVLIYVHSQGIVHRDIKPDNIILRARDNKPVLIDFGAVKETMGTVVTASGRDTNSIVIGTPGFMPSEQTAGRPVYGSDLYSLALTGIYLLTSKYPQAFTTDLATGEIRWRQDAPHTSTTLAEILDRAIHPYPHDRFKSAKEMLDTLQNEVNVNVSSTVMSSPVSGGNAGVATAVVAPAPNNYSQVKNTHTGGLKAWQKASIVGSIVGVFVMGALVVNSYVNRTPNTQPVATNSVENSEVSTTGNESNTETINPPNQQSQAPNPNNLPTETSSDRHSSTSTARPYSQNNNTPLEPSRDRNNFPTNPPSEDVNNSNPNNYPSEVPSDRSLSAIDENRAKEVVEELYSLLSQKSFDEARNIYSPQLAAQFEPNFFSQFTNVTVENLQPISQTDSSVDLIGENTYIYPDGSTQREQRSYTVSNLNGELKITDSKFVKVTKKK